MTDEQDKKPVNEDNVQAACSNQSTTDREDNEA